MDHRACLRRHRPGPLCSPRQGTIHRHGPRTGAPSRTAIRSSKSIETDERESAYRRSEW